MKVHRTDCNYRWRCCHCVAAAWTLSTVRSNYVPEISVL